MEATPGGGVPREETGAVGEVSADLVWRPTAAVEPPSKMKRSSSIIARARAAAAADGPRKGRGGGGSFRERAGSRASSRAGSRAGSRAASPTSNDRDVSVDQYSTDASSAGWTARDKSSKAEGEELGHSVDISRLPSENSIAGSEVSEGGASRAAQLRILTMQSFSAKMQSGSFREPRSGTTTPRRGGGSTTAETPGNRSLTRISSARRRFMSNESHGKKAHDGKGSESGEEEADGGGANRSAPLARMKSLSILTSRLAERGIPTAPQHSVSGSIVDNPAESAGTSPQDMQSSDGALAGSGARVSALEAMKKAMQRSPYMSLVSPGTSPMISVTSARSVNSPVRKHLQMLAGRITEKWNLPANQSSAEAAPATLQGDHQKEPSGQSRPPAQRFLKRQRSDTKLKSETTKGGGHGPRELSYPLKAVVNIYTVMPYEEKQPKLNQMKISESFCKMASFGDSARSNSSAMAAALGTASQDKLTPSFISPSMANLVEKSRDQSDLEAGESAGKDSGDRGRYFPSLTHAFGDQMNFIKMMASRTHNPFDEDETMNQKGLLANWRLRVVYLYPLVYIIFICLDLVLLASGQIMWGTNSDDFLCSSSMSQQFLGLRSLVVSFHGLLLTQNLCAMDTDGHLHFLRFVHRGRYSRQSMVQSNVYTLAMVFEDVLNSLRGLWAYTWDFIIVVSSAILLGLHSLSCTAQPDPIAYAVIRRLHLMVHALCAFRAAWGCQALIKDLHIRLKVAVSKNKRRFICKKNHFNLDLTYVCDRVIAMAMPCVDGGATAYRNDIREVARFFATRHYGHFLIFNLCEEHEEGGNGNYDTGLLYEQVVKIPIRDHDVPLLHELVNFCDRAYSFLDEHPSNVVAIHCQGGKGRTGLFVSALLLWVGFKQNHEDCLDLFASRRTDKSVSSQYQGVSAPSQLRYMKYISSVLMKQNPDYRSPALLVLRGIFFNTVPFAKQILGTTDRYFLSYTIKCQGIVIYDSARMLGLSLIKHNIPRDSKIDLKCDAVAVRVCPLFPALPPLAKELCVFMNNSQGDVRVTFYLYDREKILSNTGAVNFSGLQARQGGSSWRNSQSKSDGTLDSAAGLFSYASACVRTFFFSFNTAFVRGHSFELSRDEVDGPHTAAPFDFDERFGVILTFRKSGSQRHLKMMNDAVKPEIKPIMHVPEDFRLRANVAFRSRLVAAEAMSSVCKEPMTFKQGDVIFVQGVLPNGIFRDFENRINPESPPFSSGDLVYIKKGSGCWTYTHGSGMGVEGFASEDNNFHGIGDLLGIHEFLLPLQDPLATYGAMSGYFVAQSDTVEVLYIKGTSNPPPLNMYNESTANALVIYEVMADQLRFSSLRIQAKLRRCITFLNSKTCVDSGDISRSLRAMRVREIMDVFSIPSHERCLQLVPATRFSAAKSLEGKSPDGRSDRNSFKKKNRLESMSMSMSMAHIFSKDLSKDISVHDFDDGLLKNGVCGTVAVFADYIVFSGDSSPEADILIPLKAVKSIGVQPDVVSVNLENGISTLGVYDRLQDSIKGRSSPLWYRGTRGKPRTNSITSNSSATWKEEETVGLVAFRTSEAAAIGFAAEHRLNIVEAVNGLAQQTNVLSIFPGPETLKNYKAKSEEEIFGSESPSSAAQHEVDHSEQTRESQVVQILQQLGKHMIHADNTEIVRKGDIDDSIVHIISGHAEEITEDNQLIRKIEPGDILGIENILSVGTGHSATVIAKGSVNVRVYHGIAHILQGRPDLGPTFWRIIVRVLAMRNARDLLSLTAWQPQQQSDSYYGWNG